MLEYLDDLESDFSAIHRISDMYSLPSPMFFRFAERIGAYKGVMQLLIQRESEGEQMSKGTVAENGDKVREVPSDAASLRAQFGEYMDVVEV